MTTPDLEAKCPLCGATVMRSMASEHLRDHRRGQGVAKAKTKGNVRDKYERYALVAELKKQRRKSGAAVPKRPQVGKPDQMSNHKHHIIGTGGLSPRLRHEMKREAERNERKPRRHEMFASVAEAMAALTK